MTKRYILMINVEESGKVHDIKALGFNGMGLKQEQALELVNKVLEYYKKSSLTCPSPEILRKS